MAHNDFLLDYTFIPQIEDDFMFMVKKTRIIYNIFRYFHNNELLDTQFDDSIDMFGNEMYVIVKSGNVLVYDIEKYTNKFS